uniref:ATP synthase F0 subunit 8 n=1 Tax=Meitanaphis elongallis TaxID=384841 RepID=A0A1Z1MWM5_9HEMI|nr:ATP synthase F0 subunit 8 [Meitanaphis elongallis]ARW70360.1 ATP synthase F0 subunit 8 [Meitanaphis elongallis]
MAPMNWFMLFMFFMTMFFMILTITYFYFMKINKYKMINKQNIKNYNKFI